MSVSVLYWTNGPRTVGHLCQSKGKRGGRHHRLLLLILDESLLALCVTTQQIVTDTSHHPLTPAHTHTTTARASLLISLWLDCPFVRRSSRTKPSQISLKAPKSALAAQHSSTYQAKQAFLPVRQHPPPRHRTRRHACTHTPALASMHRVLTLATVAAGIGGASSLVVEEPCCSKHLHV